MATRLPDGPEPLVKVAVYMYPKQRQRLREQAARRGVSMSEYLKHLIETHHRGLMERD